MNLVQEEERRKLERTRSQTETRECKAMTRKGETTIVHELKPLKLKSPYNT